VLLCAVVCKRDGEVSLQLCCVTEVQFPWLNGRVSTSCHRGCVFNPRQIRFYISSTIIDHCSIFIVDHKMKMWPVKISEAFRNYHAYLSWPGGRVSTFYRGGAYSLPGKDIIFKLEEVLVRNVIHYVPVLLPNHHL
jgi:hypothetical protein